MPFQIVKVYNGYWEANIFLQTFSSYGLIKTLLAGFFLQIILYIRNKMRNKKELTITAGLIWSPPL